MVLPEILFDNFENKEVENGDFFCFEESENSVIETNIPIGEYITRTIPGKWAIVFATDSSGVEGINEEIARGFTDPPVIERSHIGSVGSALPVKRTDCCAFGLLYMIAWHKNFKRVLKPLTNCLRTLLCLCNSYRIDKLIMTKFNVDGSRYAIPWEFVKAEIEEVFRHSTVTLLVCEKD